MVAAVAHRGDATDHHPNAIEPPFGFDLANGVHALRSSILTSAGNRPNITDRSSRIWKGNQRKMANDCRCGVMEVIIV